MDWERFRQRLARETSEYLADLRDLRADLQRVEGWIVLGLLIAVLLMTIAWLIASVGFNPANDYVIAFMNRFGLRTCRPISNFSGVVMFIDMVMMIFLAVVSIGNAINMMKRVSRGLPREPRDLIISSTLLLFAGIGGIVFMRWIC